MDYVLQHKKNQTRDRRKSALLTMLIFALLFLSLYYYQFTKTIEKPEEITTMLLNFGDSADGLQSEEPAEQPGSEAADTEIAEAVSEPVSVPEPKVQPEPVKTAPAEKVLTGKNTKVAAPVAEKKAKTNKTSTTAPAKTSPKAAAKATQANSKTGTGGGKGNAAIGNLIKGRGTKPGSQGTTGLPGNTGDPLGGEGNGDSKIGVDRKLIAFIPGTMGRGGAQPAHNCTAAGTISIAYTVDKAGNVISARRLSGVSDACISSNSVSWVKKYVKAEKAATSSTGVYQITF